MSTLRQIDIIGFENYYQIREDGIVLSLDRYDYIKNRPIKGRIIKIHINKDSKRPFVVLYKKGIRKNAYLHRLLAEHFIPNPDNKPEINHIDGNPLNFALSNLEWSTRKENEEHAVINRLKANGERNGKVKFTDYEVAQFRQEYNSGVKIKDLSCKYNVSISHLYRLLKYGKREKTTNSKLY